MLKEAEQRLEELRVRNFAAIAEELEDEDPYLFLRAYSPGLQEYVEAHSYYRYLKDGRLMSLGDFQKKLSFTSQKVGQSSE